jgi:tetraacyldisaccharide 4'-kinase
MAGPNRTETATELLLAYPKLDVLVLDDGLQHYGLQRDLELVVFDRRGLGNGRFLPVGPLREGPARLRGVNAIVWNGGQVDRRAAAMTPAFNMHIAIDRVWNLADPSRSVAADHFRGQRINAVAGIGEPERFFDALTAAGLLFDAHPFPDHHRYTPEHFLFRREAPVLMTEKDAVKCRRFAAPNWWACRVSAQVDPGLGKLVLEKLRSGSAPS